MEGTLTLTNVALKKKHANWWIEIGIFELPALSTFSDVICLSFVSVWDLPSTIYTDMVKKKIISKLSA